MTEPFKTLGVQELNTAVGWYLMRMYPEMCVTGELCVLSWNHDEQNNPVCGVRLDTKSQDTKPQDTEAQTEETDPCPDGPWRSRLWE